MILSVMIASFGIFITYKGLRADLSLFRDRRRTAKPQTPQQKQRVRVLVATYPGFMVLGAAIGALIDSGDPVGGAIIGFLIGMFAWVPAIWILSLEVARRRWVARGR